MTVLDPISGKQVSIALSGKSPDPHGGIRFAEESSLHRRDGFADGKLESYAGEGVRSHQGLGSQDFGAEWRTRHDSNV
jgi:hypothetical protein